MTIILHITPWKAWQKAEKAGLYTTGSLAEEGFIHCSLASQVVDVANALYRECPDLCLLAIVEEQLTAPVIYEDCYKSGQVFPHIYGPLNLDAVVDVHDFPPGPQGLFHLPANLRTEVNQPNLPVDDETELRLLERHHADTLFKLVDSNREHLRRWLAWVDGTRTAADSLKFIQLALHQFSQKEALHCGIWFRGQLAGLIGFNKIDWPDRSAEIGYWLGHSYQGQGLMTRACRALINHGFGELGLNRIEIQCAAGNRRSCAIPERLGFAREGLLRQAGWLNDRFVDHYVYGLVAAEWRVPGDA